MSKTFFSSLLIATSLFLSTTIVLSACSITEPTLPNNSTLSQQNTIPYASWCSHFSAAKCLLKPSDAIGKKEWQAGMDLSQLMLASSSRIALKRSDLSRPAVIQLYKTVGASGLLSFLQSLPWEGFVMENGQLVLDHERDNAVIEVDDLKMVGARRMTFKFIGPRVMGITGLRLLSQDEAYSTDVRAIDFSEPDALGIVTSNEKITGVPVRFFNKEGLVQQVAISTPPILKSLFDLLLAPDFDWRTNLFIFLRSSDLKQMFEASKGILPEGASLQFLNALVENISAVTVGGPQGAVLSVQMQKPLSCKMTLGRVPILGQVSFITKYAAGFGMSNLDWFQNQTIAAKVYGVASPVGLVNRIEVDETEVRAKVGPFTAPLNFKKFTDGSGPRMEAVVCE
ncbi:MAG: hypothetical protein RIR26_2232 [Pseudomonadota bacterium]|jgi:hypothetical protein